MSDMYKKAIEDQRQWAKSLKLAGDGITDDREAIQSRIDASRLRAIIRDLLSYAESLESRLDSHDLGMCEDKDLKAEAAKWLTF